MSASRGVYNTKRSRKLLAVLEQGSWTFPELDFLVGGDTSSLRKVIKRMAKHGFLTREAVPGVRGTTHLISLVKPSFERLVYECLDRYDTAPLSVIASYTGRRCEHVSPPLLRMCVKGKLVRFMSEGFIDGNTSKKRVYIYRRAV